MDDEVPGPARRRRIGGGDGVAGSWWAWGLGVLVLAFALGYLFTALVFFPSSDRPPVVAVPDLREMDEGAARSAASAVGLELEMGDTLPNPDVPAGRILAQSPLPGQEVAPGSPVRVILSGGAERRAVPVVSAMTVEQATRVLEASGFQVTIEEVEDLRAAGRVVGVEPGPGTELQVPAPVRLRVSSGPPLVEVPDLLGMDEAAAAAALQAVGLELGEIDYRFGGFTVEELVTGQEPVAGDSIEHGSDVRVRMSTNRLLGRRRQQ